MVDPLLIPCGPPRPPDPVPFAPSEPPVGSSDGRGFAGNVENRQMIIASGPPMTRAGMRLEAGGEREQRDSALGPNALHNGGS